MDQVAPQKTALERLLDKKGKFHIFHGMNDADIISIVDKVEFRVFDIGEIIIREGDKTDMIYFIFSGKCNVIANKGIVGTLGVGSLFGEIAGLEKQPRAATVRATTKTMALTFTIKYDSFERSIVPFAHFFRNVTKDLISKLARANKRKCS